MLFETFAAWLFKIWLGFLTVDGVIAVGFGIAVLVGKLKGKSTRITRTQVENEDGEMEELITEEVVGEIEYDIRRNTSKKTVSEFLRLPSQEQNSYIAAEFAPEPIGTDEFNNLPQTYNHPRIYYENECAICLDGYCQVIYLPCLHYCACCRCDLAHITTQFSVRAEGLSHLPQYRNKIVDQDLLKEYLREGVFKCFMCRESITSRRLVAS